MKDVPGSKKVTSVIESQMNCQKKTLVTIAHNVYGVNRGEFDAMSTCGVIKKY